MLGDRLFLLQEGRYRLVAIVDEGVGSIDCWLHDTVDQADNGRIDQEDQADREGSEEGVKVDRFGAAEVPPNAVGDEPKGSEAADGLPYPNEFAAFAEHCLKDGGEGGLEALDGGRHMGIFIA